MEYAELSGSDHLRIHLDSFHMAVEESDAAQAIRAAMPRLAYLELGQSGRGLLSTGAVDIPRLVQGALDDGYEGRWGVEAFSRSILPEFVADMLGAEAMEWNQVTAGLMYGPAYSIMGGTANVMRNILGERVLGLPREPSAR